MIVQEKINKDGTWLMDRVNALGLEFDEFKLMDWNQMWGIMVYDSERVKRPEELPPYVKVRLAAEVRQKQATAGGKEGVAAAVTK